MKVRSRRYLVEAVEPAREPHWEQTLVDLSCLEDDAQGERLSALWEREADAHVLQQADWSHLARTGFDAPHVFSAYLHALRWNLVTSTNPRLFQMPHRAGIQITSYQLEPLKKALQRPRVNLFIADDVGLGKTIEAGLILREMIMRQKVKRIVIACPASLVAQWQGEMEARFGLSFVILDRDYLFNCRRERGYAINPWTTHSQFIVSHSLLRDEQYASPLRDWLNQHRSSSMLVLDEAHHAAPATSSSYAIDSQFTRGMRELTPLFEHRLFLSATPHNGHLNSFSALLAMLDPQRCIHGEQIKDPRLLGQVMVRRLKDELREAVPGLGLPKREVVQHDISGLPDGAPDLALMRLLTQYRALREKRLEGSRRSQQTAANLVITTLQKRLFSSIEAFNSTLRVHRKSMEKVAVESEKEPEVSADLLTEVNAPNADDERADRPEEEVTEGIEQAVALATDRSRGSQQISPEEIALLDRMAEIASQSRRLADPRLTDAKEGLVPWIRKNLLNLDGSWNSRRVLIFTEFTETKTYLRQQFETAFANTDRAEDRIATYQGGPGGGRLDEINEDRLKSENAAQAAAAQTEADRVKRENEAQRASAQANLDRAAADKAQAVREKAELRVILLSQFNAVLQARDTARGLVVNMSDVLFDTGKYSLRPGAREKLAKVAGIVSGHPGLKLDVEGHTDNVGGDDYNQHLSEQRGSAVRDYLTQSGMASASVTTEGFGKTQSVASNDTPSGRQQNRRVEIVISGEVIGTEIGMPAVRK